MADYDFDVQGQISAVDDANKTVTITGPSGSLTIKVLPYTEIKGDDCGAFGQDIYGSFKDLTVGKFVKLKLCLMEVTTHITRITPRRSTQQLVFQKICN